MIHEPKMDAGVSRAVAVLLQERLEAVNATVPPALDVPFFLNSFRHACGAARTSVSAGKGVSTNIDCPEQYVLAEDGVHAILYREGKCKKCGALARSSKGRVVLAAQRPPIANRVARD